MQFQVADLQHVAFVNGLLQFQFREINRDSLSRYLGVGRHAVWFGQQANTIAVSNSGRRRQDVLGLFHTLNVIDVGVRCHKVFAIGQRKIHLPDHFNDLVNSILIANVDQQPVVAVENEIDAATKTAFGLIVHLDHMRKQLVPR